MLMVKQHESKNFKLKLQTHHWKQKKTNGHIVNSIQLNSTLSNRSESKLDIKATE